MPFPAVQPIESFHPPSSLFGKVTLVDAHDSFTHNLIQLFLSLGAPVTSLRSKEVTLETLEQQIGDYLVLSPGPQTPSEAGVMKEAISHFYGRVPILGVCLGMQAINEVFGGTTICSSTPVHGQASEITHDSSGLFAAVPNPTPVARYHSLIVADLPDRFHVQSTFKGITMAFHEPGKMAAVQFHPESFLTKHGPVMVSNFLEGVF